MDSCPVDFLIEETDCVALQKIYEFFQNNNAKDVFTFDVEECSEIRYERLGLDVRPGAPCINIQSNGRAMHISVLKEDTNKKVGEFHAYGFIGLRKVSKVRFLKRQKQGEGNEHQMEYFIELLDVTRTMVRIYKNTFLVFLPLENSKPA